MVVDDQCTSCRSYSAMRPRGALARTLYNKQIADRHLAHMDYSQWYKVDEGALEADVRAMFVQMSMDSETEHFMEESSDKSENIFLQIFYSLVKILLSFFMSHTSINGLLGRGSMFVFSTGQFERLTGLRSDDITSKSLLDLGSGDGSVTETMRTFFHRVHVTEISKTMKSQLASKGFKVVDETLAPTEKYDVVSCLNVLDRCDKPVTMLQYIRQSIKPNGIGLIAIVLPFHPWVETASRKKQVEDINISGRTLEEQVNSLTTQIFPNAGLKVVNWTRLPYLCEGDLNQSFYWLDDVVFVVSLDRSYDPNLHRSKFCLSTDKPHK